MRWIEDPCSVGYTPNIYILLYMYAYKLYLVSFTFETLAICNLYRPIIDV